MTSTNEIHVSSLVLPQSSRQLVSVTPGPLRHPGIQLDKLSLCGDMKVQHAALEDVVACKGDEALLQVLIRRRETALRALGAKHMKMISRSSVASHLSRTGTLENAGTSLHPTYGFFFLPGTGLKGLARAWAETVWAPGQKDQDAAWTRIEAVFGWAQRSEEHKQRWRPEEIDIPAGSSAGRIVFHDAWPTSWPSLEVDIANNHHTEYYRGQDDPGDWESPIPVYFLAIGAGAEFDFAVSGRTPADGKLIDLACAWLAAALQWEGAGAKTAAGYGRFRPVDANVPTSLPTQTEHVDYDLRLASPAFLAGAHQHVDDCELRAPTLRGQLRWWWRTLHSAHLDQGSLRKLEALVWGDTNAGSGVRISVDFLAGGRPAQHPDKRDQRFLNQHEIRTSSRGSKLIPGLFYASYGMAERGPRRFYRPEGSVWKITLTVRDGYIDETRIPAQFLRQQAEAALWLLLSFGGVGSRARKGFGSFDDISIEAVSSVEDCKSVAKIFRETCQLNFESGSRADAPSLDEAMFLQCDTPWTDPWHAIDHAGTMLQTFTKSRRGNDRLPLGLPRRVGHGKNSVQLKTKTGIDRHAAPAIWSLSTRSDELISIRLTCFPAHRLPDTQTSKAVLGELVEHVRTEFGALVKLTPGRGPRRPGKSEGFGGQTGSSAPTKGMPINQVKKGQIIQAVLLEEKTKKGGWRARHEASGRVSPIQNSMEVPPEQRAGDIVELYVFSNDAFQWLSDTVRKKLARSPADQNAFLGSRRGGPQGRRR